MKMRVYVEGRTIVSTRLPLRVFTWGLHLMFSSCVLHRYRGGLECATIPDSASPPLIASRSECL